MSDSHRRYHAVQEKMSQLLPDLWQTNQEWVVNLSLLISACVKAKDLTQHSLASEMPLAAQDTSLAQRQRRWLMNTRVDIRQVYRQLIQPVLRAASARTVSLILDTTDAGANSHLLIGSVAYHQRAIPVSWRAGEGKRGHTSGHEQVSLLEDIRSSLPDDADVVLVGDGEFGHVPMIEWLDGTPWAFVLRTAQDTYVEIEGEWHRLDSLGVRPGKTLWLENVRFTRAHAFGPVNLLLTWDKNRDDLLPLVTNLSTPQETTHWYRRRYWCEPLHGDIKGHGFDWQTCRLRHPERIERMMLVIALAYLWLLNLGGFAWVSGQSKYVDRTDRRDRSLFTIGRQWLNRLLKLNMPIHISFFPYPFLHHYPQAGVG